jgi:hypothetical protein
MCSSFCTFSKRPMDMPCQADSVCQLALHPQQFAHVT